MKPKSPKPRRIWTTGSEVIGFVLVIADPESQGGEFGSEPAMETGLLGDHVQDQGSTVNGRQRSGPAVFANSAISINFQCFPFVS